MRDFLFNNDKQEAPVIGLINERPSLINTGCGTTSTLTTVCIVCRKYYRRYVKIHGLAATGRGSGVITGGELYYGFYSRKLFKLVSLRKRKRNLR